MSVSIILRGRTQSVQDFLDSAGVWKQGEIAIVGDAIYIAKNNGTKVAGQGAVGPAVQFNVFENIADIGDGFVPVDENNRIHESYMPVDSLLYKGAYNASTDTPSLPATDANRASHFYTVSVAGTRHSQAFKVGDWVLYDASGNFQRVNTTSHTHAIADITGLQTALNSKATASDLTSHVNSTSNPHSVTKAQVGLGNVDNTSDANKPISTATQTALNLKADDAAISAVGKSNDYNDLDNKPSIPSDVGDLTDTGSILFDGNYSSLTNKPDLSVLEEVLVFANLAAFPTTGETGKVYIAEDTGYMYRWGGASGYIQLTDQTAIWGQISGTLADQTDLNNALEAKATASDLTSHVNSTSNPHSVTKAQVGLGNVDNTSDANKPISTATQDALNLKADDSDLTSHVNDTTNPHSVTKAQVGLGNVDNVSAANLRDRTTHTGSQAISTITNLQTTLDAKIGDAPVNNKPYVRVNAVWVELDEINGGTF